MISNCDLDRLEEESVLVFLVFTLRAPKTGQPIRINPTSSLILKIHDHISSTLHGPSTFFCHFFQENYIYDQVNRPLEICYRSTLCKLILVQQSLKRQLKFSTLRISSKVQRWTSTQVPLTTFWVQLWPSFLQLLVEFPTSGVSAHYSRSRQSIKLVRPILAIAVSHSASTIIHSTSSHCSLSLMSVEHHLGLMAPRK